MHIYCRITNYTLNVGGWNFLACEDCERIKRKIIKAKGRAEKRRLNEVLKRHYAVQESHRSHYNDVA